MNDYQLRPVRQRTANILNLIFKPEVKNMSGIFTCKLGTFTWEPSTKVWQRQVKVKETPPVHAFAVVYGEFTIPNTNLNFVLIRYPFKNNWHRQILPAIHRLMKKFNVKKGDYWLDGLHPVNNDGGKNHFETNTQTQRFVLDGKDFIPFNC